MLRQERLSHHQFEIQPEDASSTLLKTASDGEQKGDSEFQSSQAFPQLSSGMATGMLEDHDYWTHGQETVRSNVEVKPECTEPSNIMTEDWQESQPFRGGLNQNEQRKISSSCSWGDILKRLKKGESPADGVTEKEDGLLYLCPYCLKQTETLSEMYQHKVCDHRLQASFRCVVENCRQVFQSLGEYEKHALKHRQHAFICTICNEHFETIDLIIIHKGSAHGKVHRMDGNHCNICHKSFSTRETLDKHAARTPHHYQCKFCGKVYKSKADQHDHELRHTSQKSFLCDICGSKFINKLSMSRHRLSHKQLRPFHCDQCEASFNKKEHLRRHQLSKHSDDKPFACSHTGCDRRFKRKDKLAEHEKMHSNDKPFMCDICGRGYRYKEGLRYHKKTHQRARQYTCSECNTQFTRPWMLRSHLTTVHHKDIKNSHAYQCEHCGKSFARPERVKRHMEKDHNEQPAWKYFCSSCKKGFPGDKSYRSHMLKLHPPGVEQAMKKKVRANMAAVKSETQKLEPIQNVLHAVERMPSVPALTPTEQSYPEPLLVVEGGAALQHPPVSWPSQAQEIIVQSVQGQRGQPGTVYPGVQVLKLHTRTASTSGDFWPHHCC